MKQVATLFLRIWFLVLTIAIFATLLHSPTAEAVSRQMPRTFTLNGDLTLYYDRFWSSQSDAIDRFAYSLNLNFHGFVIDPRLIQIDLNGILTQDFREDQTSTIDGFGAKVRFLTEKPRKGVLRFFPQPVELRYQYYSCEEGDIQDYGISMAYRLAGPRDGSSRLQAVQLGLAPRLAIRHTSAREIGQIYVPSVNWMLLLATIGLVLGFQTSSNLAGAYGVAVTGTMAVTTIIAHRVMRQRWGWGAVPSALVAGSFLVVDLAFFGSNLLKIQAGGWFALLVGAIGYLLLTTWQRGRQLLSMRLSEVAVPLPILLGDIEMENPTRVRGSAVYMTAQPDGVPSTLLYNLRHNQVLHERVVFLTVQMQEIPRVDPAERVAIERIAEGFYRVTAQLGFMEDPDIEEVIARGREKGLDITVEGTSFFVGRETLLSTDRPGMPIWREILFSVLARNTPRVTTAWNLPVEQVIEIGAQIEL